MNDTTTFGPVELRAAAADLRRLARRARSGEDPGGISVGMQFESIATGHEARADRLESEAL